MPKFCLALLLMLALVSCGGSQPSEPGALQTAPQGPAVLPRPLERALPALPEDQIAPAIQRIAAASSAVQLGSAYMDASGGVSRSSASAVLSSTAGSLSWAMYRFSGTAGEEISACAFSAAALDAGEELYLGIADYQRSSWHFFPAQSDSDGSFPLPAGAAGRWQSSVGNSYLLVLAWDGDEFDLNSLQLTYSERFSASGQVLDKQGQPVPEVLVATALGGQSTYTDAAGNYTLGGLPNGTWPLVATKDGWTFYNLPESITIQDGDAAGPTLLGDPHGSRFKHHEAIEGNDEWHNPPLWDFASPLEDTLSAIDDQVDAYSFEVAAPGSYYLRISCPQRTISIPYAAVYSEYLDTVAESTSVYQGDFLLGFHSAEPGRRYVFYMNCSGGGGDYSVSLESGETFRIGGAIRDEMDRPVYSTLLEIDNPQAGLSLAAFGGGSGSPTTYAVSAWLPGMTTVEVAAPGYTIGPPQQQFNLSGEKLDMDFEATPGSFPDSFEINDSKVEAALLPALPYEGTDPMSVFPIDGGGNDPIDYYRIEPPAGKGLRVRINYEMTSRPDRSLSSTLEDDDSLMVYDEPSADGIVILLPELTDGEAYYISVLPSHSRAVNYQLFVDVFDAVPLQFAARVLPSTLIPDAFFVVHDEDFSMELRREAQEDGLTDPLYLPTGSILRVECMRFGMAMDRHTRSVTAGSAAQTVFFDATDQLPDSLEPNSNSDPAELPTLELPAVVEATLSWVSDDVDYYLLNPQGSDPFLLEFDSPADRALISMAVYDSSDQFVTSFEISPGQSLRIENDGQSGQRLEVYSSEQELPYTLSISEEPAFLIQGEILDDAAAPVFGSQVYNLTLGRAYEVQPDGSYRSEPLAPGNYTMHYLALNHEPQEKTVNVLIEDADVTEDFSGMTASDKDDLEPNNSVPTAKPVGIGALYTMNVGTPGDPQDYLSIEAEAGQRLLISLRSSGDLLLFGDVYRGAALELDLGSLYRSAPDERRFIVDSPSAQTYILQIGGLDSYSLQVTELP